MKVFALVGMPGSGKTEATLILKKLNIPVVVMGDRIREEMNKLNIEINSKNMREFMINLREKEGMDVIARKCLSKINELNSEYVVIDGLRNPEEVDFFKKHLENFKVISILASPEIRYQRLMQRKREDDSLDINLLKERDQKELSVGIGKVIEQADFRILNEGTKENLINEFKRIIFEK
ncbi:MAG: AAA family ATPase [Candidatus Helarchaeota archaeon]